MFLCKVEERHRILPAPRRQLHVDGPFQLPHAGHGADALIVEPDESGPCVVPAVDKAVAKFLALRTVLHDRPESRDAPWTAWHELYTNASQSGETKKVEDLLSFFNPFRYAFIHQR